MFEFVSEKQLLRDYATPAVKRDGKIVKEANADLQPFDYRKEFRKFTAEQLATAWDLPPPAGSDAALEAEWDEEEDVAPRRGKATGKAAAKATGKRKPAEEVDEDEEVDDDAEAEAEAEEPQPRGRVRTRNAPQAVDEDEDEEDADDVEEEDDPPPRGRARTAAKPAPARGKAPARGTRSRTTVIEDDDEIPF
jgi:hypothetical protein